MKLLQSVITTMYILTSVCRGDRYKYHVGVEERQQQVIYSTTNLTMEIGTEWNNKIAILGAGPSGLVAAKEVLENGMIPTIFERERDIGGIWNLQKGSVWNTMHTNISKFTTTFGDFHWQKDSEMFPSVESMFEYLNQYAQKWNLRNYIKFNSNVVKVTAIEKDVSSDIGSEGWIVQWASDDNIAELQSESFKGMIVATGIFSKANIPAVPGLYSFPGKIIHSKYYKSGVPFEGLKVLTIGGSMSGAEIASDVSNYCLESYHCFREPFWILKRNLPDSKRGQIIPLDLLFYTRNFYSQSKPAFDEELNNNRNMYMASICSEQQNITELAIQPDAFGRLYNVTISDQYLNQVNQKKLIVKKDQIAEVKDSTIVLQNGDKIDVDAIIFCTGYNAELGFLDEKILQKILYNQTDRLQPMILFKECCHPDLKNLFFVGMYKGPYFGVIEQQARLAARVLGGSVTLPSLEEMMKGLKKEKEIRDVQPRPQFPHPEYVLFADEISKCANSFPDLKKFAANTSSLTDVFGKQLKHDALHLEEKKTEIYERFMTESVTPSHYNLVDDPLETLKQMDLVQEAIKEMQS